MPVPKDAKRAMGIVLRDTILKALTRARSAGFDEVKAFRQALGAVLQRHPDMAPVATQRAVEEVRRHFAKPDHG